MNYNFTDGVRKALALGREAAVRLGHERMGPEHMLLGLVRVGEGVAAVALERLGVDRRRILERVAPDRHRSGRDAGTTALGELGYSSSGKKALHHAIMAAQEMGHPYVGSEHLLLGILKVEEEDGPSVLNGLGVTLEKGRAEIDRLLGAGGPTDLLIEIDDKSDVPIVDQIVASVRKAFAGGRLQPGMELPAVRRLADRLDISTGTVARAYEELERAGVLVPGDPPLVAPPGGIPEREDPEALLALVRPVVALSHRLGVRAADLRTAFERALRDVYDEGP